MIPGWLMMNLYSILIALFLFVYSNKYGVKFIKQLRIFNGLIGLLIVLLIADTLSRIDGGTPAHLFGLRVGNLFIFVLDPYIGYLIIKYIDAWTEQRVKLQRTFVKIVGGIIYTNAGLVFLMNLVDAKWFYYFENGQYMRGPLFVPRAVIILGLCLIVETYVILFKDYINKQYYKTIRMFPLIPLFFGVMQVVIPGYGFEYTGMVMTCAILFIHIQSKYISVDHVTNLVNRTIFEDIYHRKTLDYKNRGKEFTIFMIDMDRFKDINAVYGHDAGDEALIETTRVLHKTFNKNDTICRFGGDEFCVLSNMTAQTQIDEARRKIQEELDKFNEQSDTFKISLSIGNAVYNSRAVNGEEYLKYVNELMYAEKDAKRGTVVI